jgi:hypothetical protein
MAGWQINSASMPSVQASRLVRQTPCHLEIMKHMQESGSKIYLED